MNPTSFTRSTSPDLLLTRLGWRSIGYIKKNTAALNPSAVLTNPDQGERWMTMEFQLSVGEKIYGLGERFGPFIKNGQVSKAIQVSIENTDQCIRLLEGC